MDAAGHVFLLISGGAVFRLDPTGFLTQVAGNGYYGFGGDGGPATRLSSFFLMTLPSMPVATCTSRIHPVALVVAAAAPGIFTQDSSGVGPGMIFNPDGSMNSPANPAARGDVLIIQATGEGQTNPPGADGLIASDTPAVPLQLVSVQIGGSAAKIIYAGGVPGLAAGFFQVAAQVPDDAPSGEAVPIVLRIGGVASQPGVTVAVQ